MAETPSQRVALLTINQKLDEAKNALNSAFEWIGVYASEGDFTEAEYSQLYEKLMAVNMEHGMTEHLLKGFYNP